MKLSIMTLNLTALSMSTFSMTTHNVLCHNLVIKMNVIILSVVAPLSVLGKCCLGMYYNSLIVVKKASAFVTFGHFNTYIYLRARLESSWEQQWTYFYHTGPSLQLMMWAFMCITGRR
jgi:hypothetical protein